MAFALKIGTVEVEVNLGYSLYLRTSSREIFAKRDGGTPWRPHYQVVSPEEGVWSCMGWEVTYSRFRPPQIAAKG